jgi:hypothetical protein
VSDTALKLLQHILTELAESFADGVGVDEFYTGCSCLGEPMDDIAAAAQFERLCKANDPDNEGVDTLEFNEFLAWIARRHCPSDGDNLDEEEEEEEEVVMLSEDDRQKATEALNIGEFGDMCVSFAPPACEDGRCSCHPVLATPDHALKLLQPLSRFSLCNEHTGHNQFGVESYPPIPSDS